MMTKAQQKNINNMFIYLNLLTFGFVSCKNVSPKTVSVVIFEKRYPPLNYKISGAIINGKKEGLWITHDSLGKVEMEETFTNGKSFGEIKVYSDGFLVERTSDKLIKSDTVTLFEKYNGNGLIVTRGQYVNGKKKGIWSYYFDNGKALKRKIEFFEKGSKILFQAPQ